MVHATTAPPSIRDQWVPMTAEEFDRWAPDDARAEWVRGKGIIYVSASDRHQWTVALVYELIARFANLAGLGRTMTSLYQMWSRDGAWRREPDVLYVAPEHLDRWRPTRLIGPADLIVEVVSDDRVERDEEVKFADYEAEGVAEYIVIDNRAGRRRFRFVRLDEHGRYQPVEADARGRYHSLALPGCWLKAEWFWAEPLPDALELLALIAPEAVRRFLLRILPPEANGHA